MPLQGTCNDPDNYDEDRDDYSMDTIQAMAQNADSVRDKTENRLFLSPFGPLELGLGSPTGSRLGVVASCYTAVTAVSSTPRRIPSSIDRVKVVNTVLALAHLPGQDLRICSGQRHALVSGWGGVGVGRWVGVLFFWGGGGGGDPHPTHGAGFSLTSPTPTRFARVPARPSASRRSRSALAKVQGLRHHIWTIAER